MSTTAKASDHVKPCNIKQSERHNRRDAEYLASLNPRTLYVRTELSHHNESYVVPDLKGVTLLKDLDKFTESGELKPRVSIYNKQLKLDIDTEID